MRTDRFGGYMALALEPKVVHVGCFRQCVTQGS